MQTLLTELETYLQRKRKRVAGLLLPGAGPEELARLAQGLGGTPRPELLTWFGWHNGQKKPLDNGLIAGSVWSAMSLDQALEAWKRLGELKASQDLQEPWELHWFPLFDNGGGDHVVLDLHSGQVLEWFHDDVERPVLAPSLEALVGGFIRSYEEEAQAKLPRQVDWHPETAAPLSDSLAKHLDRAPLGTVIWGGPARLVPHLSDVPEYIVMLRSHPRSTWIIARSRQGLDECCERIASQLAESGDPFQYHHDTAAFSWLASLVADPQGKESVRQSTATVTIQTKKKR